MRRRLLVQRPGMLGAGVLALFAVVGLALGAYLLGQTQAQQGGTNDNEVRVQARVLEDGRTEVGLQQGGADGWSERLLPAARFLPTTATVGEWRSSSAVSLAALAVDSPGGDNLYCFIHHGATRDVFWTYVRAAAAVAARDLNINLRIDGHGDAEQQAALIDQCVADGAVGIATTLAQPDPLKDSLAAADQAGIALVSFNSGVEEASAVGTVMHVGLDDFRGGQLAGEHLTAAGASGLALCVIHEAQNAGLERRCDGLVGAYGGEVERLYTPETGDWEGIARTIGARMARPDLPQVGVVVTLNGAIGDVVLEIMERFNLRIPLATFGVGRHSIEAVIDGRMPFFIWDEPTTQGYAAVAMMKLTEETLPSWGGSSAAGANTYGSAPLLLTPRVFEREQALFMARNFRPVGDLYPFVVPTMGE